MILFLLAALAAASAPNGHGPQDQLDALAREGAVVRAGKASPDEPGVAVLRWRASGCRSVVETVQGATPTFPYLVDWSRSALVDTGTDTSLLLGGVQQYPHAPVAGGLTVTFPDAEAAAKARTAITQLQAGCVKPAP
jgi:hypothetical protein